MSHIWFPASLKNLANMETFLHSPKAIISWNISWECPPSSIVLSACFTLSTALPLKVLKFATLMNGEAGRWIAQLLRSLEGTSTPIGQVTLLLTLQAAQEPNLPWASIYFLISLNKQTKWPTWLSFPIELCIVVAGCGWILPKKVTGNMLQRLKTGHVAIHSSVAMLSSAQ